MVKLHIFGTMTYTFTTTRATGDSSTTQHKSTTTTIGNSGGPDQERHHVDFDVTAEPSAVIDGFWAMFEDLKKKIEATPSAPVEEAHAPRCGETMSDYRLRCPAIGVDLVGLPAAATWDGAALAWRMPVSVGDAS